MYHYSDKWYWKRATGCIQHPAALDRHCCGGTHLTALMDQWWGPTVAVASACPMGSPLASMPTWEAAAPAPIHTTSPVSDRFPPFFLKGFDDTPEE